MTPLTELQVRVRVRCTRFRLEYVCGVYTLRSEVDSKMSSLIVYYLSQSLSSAGNSLSWVGWLDSKPIFVAQYWDAHCHTQIIRGLRGSGVRVLTLEQKHYTLSQLLILSLSPILILIRI